MKRTVTFDHPLRTGPYEWPSGRRTSLSVLPRVRGWLGNPKVLLYIVEITLKADSVVSHKLACAVIGINGVYGWRGTNEHGGKTALPDWQDVALNERRVFCVPDSDYRTNEKVRRAWDALADYLESKGARVKMRVPETGKNGAKIGPDDFIARGGKIEDLPTVDHKKLPVATTGSCILPDCKIFSRPCPTCGDDLRRVPKPDFDDLCQRHSTTTVLASQSDSPYRLWRVFGKRCEALPQLLCSR
jgi:hypothetical protein